MKIFSPKGRGIIKAYSGAASIIKLNGFGIDDNRMITSGVSVEVVDKHDILECLGGYNYVFGFGNNPNATRYTITFIVFLGVCSDSGDDKFDSKAVELCDNFFKENKVSKKKFVKLSIGDIIYNGILISYSIKGMDPVLGAVAVTFEIIGTEDRQ